VIDQRLRLLEAMVAAVGENGYAPTTVGEIARRARVSRSTLYEHFENKEACFLAAHRDRADRLVVEATAAIATQNPRSAVGATLGVLVALAEAEPAAFSFLTHEASIAGSRAAVARDRLIGRLGDAVEESWNRAAADAFAADLPAWLLLGGATRALGIRMRRGEWHPQRLLGDLIAWVETYSVPVHARKWQGGTRGASPPEAKEKPPGGPIEPRPPGKARRRLPAAAGKRLQRERILHATARTAQAKGYVEMTVGDIVADAGVSREAFYGHFHDKAEAFAATVRFVFEQIMASSAGAFFTTPGPWPERIWGTGRAFTDFIVGQPSLAHAVFVEPYAVSADVQQPDDFLLGFTVFLEDGYRYRPEAAHVPRIASEAIGGAVLETISRQLHQNRVGELTALLPQTVYMIVAPFTGVEEAHDLIAGKVRPG
jgi:AcrR family transcriptional regulator